MDLLNVTANERQGAVSIHQVKPAGDPIPTVLLSSEQLRQEVDIMFHDIFPEFTRLDDVFNDGFSSTITVQQGIGSDDENVLEDPQLRHDLVDAFDTAFVSDIVSAPEKLPSGPYFILGESIHSAWRLYDDHLNALMISAIPDSLRAPQTYAKPCS